MNHIALWHYPIARMSLDEGIAADALRKAHRSGLHINERMSLHRAGIDGISMNVCAWVYWNPIFEMRGW